MVHSVYDLYVLVSAYIWPFYEFGLKSYFNFIVHKSYCHTNWKVTEIANTAWKKTNMAFNVYFKCVLLYLKAKHT